MPVSGGGQPNPYFGSVTINSIPKFIEKSLTYLSRYLSQPQSRINAKRATNRYIMAKMLKVKDKEKILKAAREK